RLDWLWFLGYDLDTDIPDHSVLSKTRKRWGVEIFKGFFERIVWQCVEAGLVDGSKIFVDSSLIDANASNNSVIDTNALKFQLNENYKQLESRLEEREQREEKENNPYKKVNTRYISATDPDAAIVNRGKSKLSCQIHRAVDQTSEIITATETTAGDVNEAHVMLPLIEEHKTNTGIKADTVTGDSKYGTIENFLTCHDIGIKAHIPDLRKAATKRTEKRLIFTEEKFIYQEQSDTYICPAGNTMKKKSLHMNRQSMDYGASKKSCAACGIREQCTENKTGRTVKRHLRQAELDYMREVSMSNTSKQDIKTRQHLMERSCTIKAIQI
ncbi:MAG: transposase, partial [Nitrospinae bacterium]|nr:transposase [Nitrospinota bacterium]